MPAITFAKTQVTPGLNVRAHPVGAELSQEEAAKYLLVKKTSVALCHDGVPVAILVHHEKPAFRPQLRDTRYAVQDSRRQMEDYYSLLAYFKDAPEEHYEQS